jgi:hypothetical protein
MFFLHSSALSVRCKSKVFPCKRRTHSDFELPDNEGGRPRLGSENDTYFELTWAQAHMLGDNPDVMDVSMTFTPAIRYVQNQRTFRAGSFFAWNPNPCFSVGVWGFLATGFSRFPSMGKLSQPGFSDRDCAPEYCLHAQPLRSRYQTLRPDHR